MGFIAISRHQRARHSHTISAAFWIVVGVVVVIFFGDALTLLAVALAIVSAAWWVGRELEHRVKSNHARHVSGAGSRASHSHSAVRMVGDSADRAGAVDLRHRPHRRTVKRRVIPVG